MDNNCQIVVFSDKAYNAIIRETFEWEPVETGGILLGHILDNGCWIVMDVLPPGYGEGREGDNVYHEYGYFEYNRKFVNYLAKSVAEQYDIPLELLGLWHRHPGSMDHFSGTDDGTNATFAQQNPQGTISGLINVDPQLRVTMYYLSHADAINRGRGPLNYQEVQVEIGSDLIPEDYFRLRYYRGNEKDVHPYPPQRPKTTRFSRYNNEESAGHHGCTVEDGNNASNTISEPHGIHTDSSINGEPLSAISDITEALKKNRTPLVLLIIAIVVFVLSLFSIKKDYSRLFEFFTGDKPSVETPIHKYQPDGLPQSGTASEQESNVDDDTIEKKEEKAPEPTKESGSPRENTGTPKVDSKKI